MIHEWSKVCSKSNTGVLTPGLSHLWAVFSLYYAMAWTFSVIAIQRTHFREEVTFGYYYKTMFPHYFI